MSSLTKNKGSDREEIFSCSLILKISNTRGHTYNFTIPSLFQGLFCDFNLKDMGVNGKVIIESEEKIDIPLSTNSVYLIKYEGYENNEFYKIGRAMDINRRINTFKTSIPPGIDLVLIACCPENGETEKWFHEKFNENRCKEEGAGNELFHFEKEELINVIYEYILKRFQYKRSERLGEDLPEEKEKQYEEKKVIQTPLKSNIFAFNPEEISSISLTSLIEHANRPLKWYIPEEHSVLAQKYPLCRYKSQNGSPHAGKICSELAVNMFEENNPFKWKCDDHIKYKTKTKIFIDEGNEILYPFMATISLLFGKYYNRLTSGNNIYHLLYDSRLISMTSFSDYENHNKSTNIDGLSALFLPNYTLGLLRGGGIKVSYEEKKFSHKEHKYISKTKHHSISMDKFGSKAQFHKIEINNKWYLIIEDETSTTIWNLYTRMLFVKLQRISTKCIVFDLCYLYGQTCNISFLAEKIETFLFFCISSTKTEIWCINENQGKCILSFSGKLEYDSSLLIKEKSLSITEISRESFSLSSLHDMRSFVKEWDSKYMTIECHNKFSNIYPLCEYMLKNANYNGGICSNIATNMLEESDSSCWRCQHHYNENLLGDYGRFQSRSKVILSYLDILSFFLADKYSAITSENKTYNLLLNKSYYKEKVYLKEDDRIGKIDEIKTLLSVLPDSESEYQPHESPKSCNFNRKEYEVIKNRQNETPFRYVFYVKRDCYGRYKDIVLHKYIKQDKIYSIDLSGYDYIYKLTNSDKDLLVGEKYSKTTIWNLETGKIYISLQRYNNDMCHIIEIAHICDADSKLCSRYLFCNSSVRTEIWDLDVGICIIKFNGKLMRSIT